MKSKNSDIEQRYLLLFKLDAKNLFDAIHDRQHEYIEIFSLKRNRAIFRDIFENRYAKASIRDIAHCSSEVIESLNQFHVSAEKLYWYLKHTQDMPNTIEDEVSRKVTKLERDYDMLCLYIDAELSGESQTEDSLEVSSFDEILTDDIHEDSFVLEGESFEANITEEYIQPEEYPDPDDQGDDDSLEQNNEEPDNDFNEEDIGNAN